MPSPSIQRQLDALTEGYNAADKRATLAEQALRAVLEKRIVWLKEKEEHSLALFDFQGSHAGSVIYRYVSHTSHCVGHLPVKYYGYVPAYAEEWVAAVDKESHETVESQIRHRLAERTRRILREFNKEYVDHADRRQGFKRLKECIDKINHHV